MTTLPFEIILHILSYLPYGDLHLRVPLVSRRFRALVQKPSPTSATAIDKTLFRDAPSPAPPPHGEQTSYTMNPVFKTLSYAYTVSISHVSLHNILLSTDPVSGENAFRPPAESCVYYHPWQGVEPSLPVEGTGAGGAVTVLDMMKAVVEVARQCKEVKTKDYEIKGFCWRGFNGVEFRQGKVRVYDQRTYNGYVDRAVRADLG